MAFNKRKVLTQEEIIELLIEQIMNKTIISMIITVMIESV